MSDYTKEPSGEAVAAAEQELRWLHLKPSTVAAAIRAAYAVDFPSGPVEGSERP